MQQASLDALVAHKDVFRHGKVRVAGHMLIDSGDAVALGVQRRLEFYLLPIHEDAALIGLVHARDYLNKGGFSRAVFTHDGVDLAGQQLKAHPVERLYARENLGDAL